MYRYMYYIYIYAEKERESENEEEYKYRRELSMLTIQSAYYLLERRSKDLFMGTLIGSA